MKCPNCKEELDPNISWGYYCWWCNYIFNEDLALIGCKSFDGSPPKYDKNNKLIPRRLTL